MLLFNAKVLQNPTNTFFQERIKVKTADDLRRLNQKDWTPSFFNGWQRSINNWNGSESIVIDIDGGISIEDFKKKYRHYTFYLCTSRNHQKEKNGIICDRFHVIFPITFTNDPKYYKYLLAAIVAICKADTECKDIARFFYGNPDTEVFINKGSKRITSHKRFSIKPPPKDRKIIKVNAPPGIGKSFILINHLKSVCRCKIVAPTNISAAIVGGRTWQSGLNFQRKPKGKFSRLDFIIIDEASMIRLRDFQKILAYYPCTDIICLGDPMQLRFNDNIFERFNGWTHELYLKNEKNPRMRDTLLLRFVNDLRYGKMDTDFIKNRCVHNTSVPVLSFKNYDCEVYNKQYVLGEVGTIVKSTFNEKIGTHQFYNNELHNVVSVNEWTITLQSLDTKTEKIIPAMIFNASHTLPNRQEKPNFVKAQMMTAFSIQGKTMDKIAIDLGSFVCNSKKGPVVHLDTLFRGLIVGASRVKTADDVVFPGLR